MGRYYSSTKTEADNLKKIDLSWLKANKILNGYHSTTISWTNGFTNDKSSIGIDINLLGNENTPISITPKQNITAIKRF